MPQLYLRVKYPLRFFVCYVHPVTQQYKLFENHVCNQSTYYEKYDGAAYPSYCLKLKYPLSFSVSYVRFVTQQEVFEKHLCNKSSHYEKYRRFLVTQRKPSHITTKLMLFSVSKDEWNTKEDTGKSLKNALHVLQDTKRHLLGCNDVEQWKIKPVAFAIIELR